ncbi:unnamed protein product, partial [Vitis vinifera]
MMLKSSVCPE